MFSPHIKSGHQEATQHGEGEGVGQAPQSHLQGLRVGVGR